MLYHLSGTPDKPRHAGEHYEKALFSTYRLIKKFLQLPKLYMLKIQAKEIVLLENFSQAFLSF